MKRYTKIIIAATLFTLLPATAWCAVIKGTVRDLSSGEALAGATVSVSGTTMADVNRLMKQFEDTRKMMKAVAGGGLKMPKMPGGMRRR